MSDYKTTSPFSLVLHEWLLSLSHEVQSSMCGYSHFPIQFSALLAMITRLLFSSTLCEQLLHILPLIQYSVSGYYPFYLILSAL